MPQNSRGREKLNLWRNNSQGNIINANVKLIRITDDNTSGKSLCLLHNCYNNFDIFSKNLINILYDYLYVKVDSMSWVSSFLFYNKINGDISSYRNGLILQLMWFEKLGSIAVTIINFRSSWAHAYPWSSYSENKLFSCSFYHPLQTDQCYIVIFKFYKINILSSIKMLVFILCVICDSY